MSAPWPSKWVWLQLQDPEFRVSEVWAQCCLAASLLRDQSLQRLPLRLACESIESQLG